MAAANVAHAPSRPLVRSAATWSDAKLRLGRERPMRRRECLAFLGGAVAAWPTIARAQQGSNVHRMAIFHAALPVSALSETGGSPVWQAFFQELRRLGYEEGRNLTVERYSGAGKSEAVGQVASQIASTRPDVVLTLGSVITGRFAAAVANAIHIVAIVNDPVATGLSTSLSRPSANVTGTVVEAGLQVIGKRFELLRELRPEIHHVALLTPAYVWAEQGGTANRTRQAAQQMGIRLSCLCPESPVQEPAYRRAFAEMARDRPDAILVFEGPENFTYRKLIVELVNAARVPAIYSFREYVELGGLMAYAISLVPLFKHMAFQIDMILRGRPVAEVPFYQADRLEFVVNLIAARTLGIEMPPSLIARADEVID